MAERAERAERDGGGLWLFLLIAFGFSWAVAALIWRLDAMGDPLLYMALAFVFMCGPGLAALICALRYDGGRRLRALGIALPFNITLVWAWLIPIALVALAMAVDLILGPVRFADPAARLSEILAAQGQDAAALPMPMETLVIVQIVSLLLIGPALNAVLTLSEEFGWRGWLWDRWRPLGFWRGNLAIGAVWGAWHAPLIALGHNYPGLPLWGPVLMIVLTTLTAPLIGWVRERGGTVFHAGLFHGAFNAAAGAPILFTTARGFPWFGYIGIGGFAALALACLVLVLVRRDGRGTARRRGDSAPDRSW